MKFSKKIISAFLGAAMALPIAVQAEEGKPSVDDLNPLHRPGIPSIHDLFVMNVVLSTTLPIYAYERQEGVAINYAGAFEVMYHNIENYGLIRGQAFENAINIIQTYDPENWRSYAVYCENPAIEATVNLTAKNLKRLMGRNPYGHAGLLEIIKDLYAPDTGTYVMLAASNAAARQQGMNPDLAACNQVPDIDTAQFLPPLRPLRFAVAASPIPPARPNTTKVGYGENLRLPVPRPTIGGGNGSASVAVAQ